MTDKAGAGFVIAGKVAATASTSAKLSCGDDSPTGAQFGKQADWEAWEAWQRLMREL